jgi:group I intron endonuclease
MKLNQSSERIFCVYKITNLVNGKIYVGKTSDVDKRLSRHFKIAESKEEKAYQYLHRSINKYGSNNFVIEVLEDKLTEVDAFEMEKFWIKELNSKDPSVGMNLTDGGEGATGLEWSEESRLNISGSNNHNFGKSLSEETKEKISASVSGDGNGFW